MKNNIQLTPDQQEAFEDIKKWLSPEDGSNFKTLSGFAGTGKTTLLDFIVDYAQNELKKKTMVTATTNKAVKVLTEKVDTNRFSTIHSVLGIKAKKRGTLEIFEPDNYNDSSITDFDFVVIDEASMISSEDTSPEVPSLLTIIRQQTSFTKTKVLFCGDPAQLQPINETVSRCFNFSPVTLITIVRHDDGIAKVAEKLRLRKSVTPIRELLSPPDVVEATYKEVKPLFENWREEPDKVRLLTWRNESVERWNRTLRAADYGDNDLPPFVEGDILIANEPCFEYVPELQDEVIVMANSQEAEVLSVREKGHHYELLSKIIGEGKKVKLRVMKKSYEDKFNRYLQKLAIEKNWKDFWSKKKYFHNVRHCYSLTTHKSQGSTFESVVVDTKDMSLNRDIENRNQLLYVGITRAAKQVYLI